MANTYTQLYYHVIFAVKGRANLISPLWKNDIYKYINGIISHKKQKLIIINGMPDHTHLLLGMQPDLCLSDLIRDVKAGSSRLINEKKLVVGNFEWQKGFGAFSLGYSQLDKIVEYIKKQEEHHKNKSFKEEYIAFLKLYNIDFRSEYIFEEI